MTDDRYKELMKRRDSVMPDVDKGLAEQTALGKGALLVIELLDELEATRESITQIKDCAKDFDWHTLENTEPLRMILQDREPWVFKSHDPEGGWVRWDG